MAQVACIKYNKEDMTNQKFYTKVVEITIQGLSPKLYLKQTWEDMKIECHNYPVRQNCESRYYPDNHQNISKTKCN